MAEPRETNHSGEEEDLTPSFVRDRRSPTAPPVRARRAPQTTKPSGTGKAQATGADGQNKAVAPVTRAQDAPKRSQQAVTPASGDAPKPPVRAVRRPGEGRQPDKPVPRANTAVPGEAGPIAARGQATTQKSVSPKLAQSEIPAENPGEEQAHTRTPRRRIILLIAVVAALIVGGWLFAREFLTVREVQILGAENAVGWTESHVLAAVGLVDGTPMWRVDADAIDEQIAKSFSSLAGAEVTKKFPGKVYIIPIPAVPCCKVLYEGSYYVLSSELKVLYEDTDARADLPELLLGEIVSCEVGNILELPGAYDREIVCEVVEALGGLFPPEDVKTVDLTNRYSISITYKSKYKLLFGNRDRMEQKAKLALAAISDPIIQQASAAEIDVSSGIKASVKITENGN
jgi:cell division septal protein FtsQ